MRIGQLWSYGRPFSQKYPHEKRKCLFKNTKLSEYQTVAVRFKAKGQAFTLTLENQLQVISAIL